MFDESLPGWNGLRAWQRVTNNYGRDATKTPVTVLFILGERRILTDLQTSDNHLFSIFFPIIDNECDHKFFVMLDKLQKS